MYGLYSIHARGWHQRHVLLLRVIIGWTGFFHKIKFEIERDNRYDGTCLHQWHQHSDLLFRLNFAHKRKTSQGAHKKKHDLHDTIYTQKSILSRHSRETTFETQNEHTRCQQILTSLTQLCKYDFCLYLSVCLFCVELSNGSICLRLFNHAGAWSLVLVAKLFIRYLRI